MIAKNKQGILLGLVAVVLVVVSLIGLEDKVFPNRVDVNGEKKPYTTAANSGLAVGGKLKNKLAQSWDQAYVIAEKVVADLGEVVGRKITGALEEDANSVTIRVMGIMRGSDGGYQAIINRSLVKAGGMVSGCHVVRIEADFVELKIQGTLKTLRLNESTRFRRKAFSDLVLEDVVNEGSIWRAKINGYMYRAGDEIDSETRVRAVTPQEVLVMRAGTMVGLKISN